MFDALRREQLNGPLRNRSNGLNEEQFGRTYGYTVTFNTAGACFCRCWVFFRAWLRGAMTVVGDDA